MNFINKKKFVYVLLILILFLIDRISKRFALVFFTNEFKINSYLSLQLIFNRGISWGLFDSANNLIYLFLTSIVILVTLFLAYYSYNRFKEGNEIFAELIILIGSVSNILDRFFYNGVIDFIYLHYLKWSFPVFNFADVLISIGCAILFYKIVFCKDEVLHQEL